MSQKVLAERLGVTQPSVWQIEKGTDDTLAVELGTLLKLAKALNCSIGELVAGVDRDYDNAAKTRGETARQDEDAMATLLRQQLDDQRAFIEQVRRTAGAVIQVAVHEEHRLQRATEPGAKRTRSQRRAG